MSVRQKLSGGLWTAWFCLVLGVADNAIGQAAENPPPGGPDVSVFQLMVRQFLLAAEQEEGEWRLQQLGRMISGNLFNSGSQAVFDHKRNLLRNAYEQATETGKPAFGTLDRALTERYQAVSRTTQALWYRALPVAGLVVGGVGGFFLWGGWGAAIGAIVLEEGVRRTRNYFVGNAWRYTSFSGAGVPAGDASGAPGSASGRSGIVGALDNAANAMGASGASPGTNP